jgi:hypothetical protein
VSHRPKSINGVKHARRCCCPACDPGGELTAAIIKAARERPAPPIVPTVAQVLRCASPRAPRRPPSEETNRFRELLREGLSAAAAIAQIETEKGTAT